MQGASKASRGREPIRMMATFPKRHNIVAVPNSRSQLLTQKADQVQPPTDNPRKASATTWRMGASQTAVNPGFPHFGRHRCASEAAAKSSKSLAGELPNSKFNGTHSPDGRVAEWFKAAVLKTAVGE